VGQVTGEFSYHQEMNNTKYLLVVPLIKNYYVLLPHVFTLATASIYYYQIPF